MSRDQEIGFPLGSLHTSFLGDWVGRGQEVGLPLSSLHVSFFLGPGSAAAKKLGSHWIPFIFVFWAPGSDRWGAAMKLGSRWAPFIFLSFSDLGRMGGPRPRSWAPIGLPSCFLLSGLLGRMGGQRFYCLSGLLIRMVSRPRSWARIDGWVVAKNPFFLPFWFPGLPLCFFFSGAAKKLTSRWAPFIFPSFWAPGSDGWVAVMKLDSYWAPFLSFLGSWVEWVGRGQEAGLLLGSLHVSSFLGPGSDGPRHRSWAPINLLSYFFSGLLGRMGGPWPRRWARVGFPSYFLLSGSDGWAAVKKLSWHWTPCILFGLLGGWVGCGQGLGALHLSFLRFGSVRAPASDRPRSPGWAPLAFLRSQGQGCSHH